jgi:DnaJ-class molecular chaperone
MNLLKAQTILELPDNYSDADLKRNYRSLVMKYHPDKCKETNSDKFIEIQEAYAFLLETDHDDDHNIFNTINNFFKKISVDIPQKFKIHDKIKLKLDIKDYFTGVDKVIKVKKSCKCNVDLCINCVGTGYNIQPNCNINVCMECIGDGYISNCDCFEDVSVKLPKKFKIVNPKFDIIISDTNYYFEKESLYYRFDISLKESLLGFEKTFKDPFDREHLISVKQIIKPGYGYVVKINDCELILVFEVIYPKKLSSKMKKAILDLM